MFCLRRPIVVQPGSHAIACLLSTIGIFACESGSRQHLLGLMNFTGILTEGGVVFRNLFSQRYSESKSILQIPGLGSIDKIFEVKPFEFDQ